MNDGEHKKCNLKVLCLEDSPMDAQLIYEHLCKDSKYQIQMDSVSKEVDFVSAIKFKKYEMILADFMLPGFNGFVALEHVKSICPSTPFICVSGFIGEETVVELLKLGASDYVSKNKLGRLMFSIERSINEFKAVEEKEKWAAELHIATQKIENLAYHDFLTDLPNRVILVDRLQQAIDLAKRTNKKIGVLFLDLDGFKTINDTFGHFQGDELLKDVAARLLSLVRECDTVARMGGDEFIIMVQNLESDDDILTIANKVIDAFNEPFDLNHNEIYVTASIGISVYPTDGETHESLLKNADLAMYKAKEKGKNQSILCTTSMKDIITENMTLSNGLYRSLERNELEVYYQPQINLNSKKIIGLEALLRWNHPELGLVLPGKFIHLAEQNGLINPIGKWVLNTVCMQNKAWQEEGLVPIRIAVNLSIIQFQNPVIVSQIKEILEKTKLLPQYLELEITEGIAMRDTDYIIRVLNAFQEMGIYITIDDFGTEFSSLKYLKLLPINQIKIPLPFTQGINVDKRDEAIVKTIIALAKNMGLDVIAEGVETQQ